VARVPKPDGRSGTVAHDGHGAVAWRNPTWRPATSASARVARALVVAVVFLTRGVSPSSPSRGSRRGKLEVRRRESYGDPRHAERSSYEATDGYTSQVNLDYQATEQAPPNTPF
jgi:hypothetical protein